MPSPSVWSHDLPFNSCRRPRASRRARGRPAGASQHNDEAIEPATYGGGRNERATAGGELSRLTIPAGGGFSVRLDAGERLRIVDLHGQQAVDFLCYSAALPVDRYNAPNTMKINGNIYLEQRNETVFRSGGGVDAHHRRYLWQA